MVHRKSGQVVFVNSVAGKVPIPYRSSFAASKHAIQAFADSLRAEVAMHQVKVLVCNPEYISSDLSNNDVAKAGTMDEGISSHSFRFTYPFERRSISTLSYRKGLAPTRRFPATNRREPFPGDASRDQRGHAGVVSIRTLAQSDLPGVFPLHDGEARRAGVHPRRNRQILISLPRRRRLPRKNLIIYVKSLTNVRNGNILSEQQFTSNIIIL